MRKCDWYYANTDKNWDLLTKKQKRKWLKNNPQPFSANIHRDEILKLIAIAARSTSDVFRLEYRETGIGGVWTLVDLHTLEEHDATCMNHW